MYRAFLVGDPHSRRNPQGRKILATNALRIRTRQLLLPHLANYFPARAPPQQLEIAAAEIPAAHQHVAECSQ